MCPRHWWCSRYFCRSCLQAKYELDRQLEELAHQERLDEEDEQRMLAFEAENERRRVEWEKEKAARRFADELARLEADVASLPPSAPAHRVRHCLAVSG